MPNDEHWLPGDRRHVLILFGINLISHQRVRNTTNILWYFGVGVCLFASSIIFSRRRLLVFAPHLHNHITKNTIATIHKPNIQYAMKESEKNSLLISEM
jgi:hypothetical protein